ncbi:MAG: DUF4345 domain-containing protein [Pseudomonadota bacterium]
MNATLFLRIIAAILLAFGAIYLLNPMLLAGRAEISAAPSGVTDIRATYGGFQIGFAIFLFWACAAEDTIKPALVATMVTFASVGLARLFGVVVDGELSGFNQIGLAFEAVLTLVCAIYLFAQKRARPQ